MYSTDPLRDTEFLIRRVYAYVAYRVGDGPDAEDITSEVFERALRYRKSYDSRKGEPVAWLIGIARTCINGASPPEELLADPDELEDAIDSDAEDTRVDRLDLHSAIEALDERDRELIALRYGADLTARQIASLLAERTNTVEVALHRALGRLRATLGAEKGARGRMRVDSA